MQNRSGCGFVEAASRRHGIITSKLPLARLCVCKAHAPVPAHRALRTLNHPKPQHVRFCCGRFAASWYNDDKTVQKRKAGRILWTSVRKLCGAFGSGHIIWTKCSHPGKLKPPPGPAEYRTRRPVRGKQLCSTAWKAALCRSCTTRCTAGKPCCRPGATGACPLCFPLRKAEFFSPRSPRLRGKRRGSIPAASL